MQHFVFFKFHQVTFIKCYLFAGYTPVHISY